MASPSPRNSALAPVAAVVAGIAAFSAMDATIKSAALTVGIYSALLWRNGLGTAMILPVWLASKPKWPVRRVLAIHLLRSTVNSGMALLFFVALTRLPMAEGMALSFIAPLIALYLAAVLLGERIRRAAIFASLLGLAGVVVIVVERLGSGTADRQAFIGIAAVLASAVLYAVNLVLQRKQALLAGPVEIALFQNLVVGSILALFAPWFAVVPSAQVLGVIILGAGLATAALLLLAWGYARAEAQVLLPIEYTGFVSAALFGWLCFDEPVSGATSLGAALIVLGCWIGTRKADGEHLEQTSA